MHVKTYQCLAYSWCLMKDGYCYHHYHHYHHHFNKSQPSSLLKEQFKLQHFYI